MALSFRTASEGWSPLGFSGTMMYTLDSGESWSSIFSPDSIPMHDVMFSDKRHGFMVGAEGRILKYNTAILDVKEHSSGSIPSNNHLLQNYPNPFNPKTDLRFGITQSGLVTLKIYNILGDEIATLVNENKEAGKYSIEWNAENVPSGLYFYRLSVERNGIPFYNETKKMVLLK